MARLVDKILDYRPAHIIERVEHDGHDNNLEEEILEAGNYNGQEQHASCREERAPVLNGKQHSEEEDHQAICL